MGPNEPLPRDRSPDPGGAAAAPVPPGRAGGGRKVPLRFLVLAVFLGLWTWKLLEPSPVPEAVSSNLSAFLAGDRKFYLAKSLHASAYAFLTVLIMTLPAPLHWRRYGVGLLALHGAATEIGQTFVPNRTGRVEDVLIDWSGIVAALVLCRVLSGARRRTV